MIESKSENIDTCIFLFKFMMILEKISEFFFGYNFGISPWQTTYVPQRGLKRIKLYLKQVRRIINIWYLIIENSATEKSDQEQRIHQRMPQLKMLA